MQPFVDDLPANVAGLEPTLLDYLETEPTTAAPRLGRWRKAAIHAGLAAVPLVTGFAVSRLTSRRTGLLAGGLAAFAIGALRVELARWFTPEPSFHAEGELGDLEIRNYDERIECRALVGDANLEAALDHGYARLACYLYGANQTGETIARTTPIITAMHAGTYQVSCVMPLDRTLESLPRPQHPDVALHVVPAHRVAVLPFRGRFTRDNVAAHERTMLEKLIDSGLSARGSVSFAAFDSPATLPAIRRNELWIEIL